MILSERLLNIANLVPKCDLAIDIGTDHAYVPIYLVKENIAKKVIAADISKGSVRKAQQNVNLNNCKDRIECRLGDGLDVLYDNEYADVIIVAGMGGMLVNYVLNINKEALKKAKRLILQPQRDNDKVRKFIHSIGFKIIDEKIFYDDNKLYNIIVCEKGQDCQYSEQEYLYGKILIDEKNSILKEYINSEMNRIEKVTKELTSSDERIIARKNELTQKYNLLKEIYICL